MPRSGADLLVLIEDKGLIAQSTPADEFSPGAPHLEFEMWEGSFTHQTGSFHLSRVGNDGWGTVGNPSRATVSSASPYGSGAVRLAIFSRRRSHSSLLKIRGPTSMSRGIMLNTATRLQGFPVRVRYPISLRLLTMAE